MSDQKDVIEKAEGSTSGVVAEREPNLEAKDLGKAVKKGLKAPYAKVLIRLMLASLLTVSVVLFAASIVKYDELQREKEILQKEKEALRTEVEELRYLLDCPVDFDYIVRVAREKLNLHLPDEIVYYNDYNE